MKERTRNIVVGLTVLTGLMMLGVLIVLFAGLPSVFQSGQTVYFKMVSSGGIRPGDPIHITDIRVGRVTEIGFADPAVPLKGLILTARVDDDIYVSPNSVLVVHKYMMGSAYITLEPSEKHGIEAKPIAPADQRRSGPLRLPGLVLYHGPMDALKPAVTTVTDIAVRIDELAGRLIETTDKLSSLITSLSNVVRTVESGEGTIGKLIYDPALYDELVGAVHQIDVMATTISALAQRWGAEGIELEMK